MPHRVRNTAGRRTAVQVAADRRSEGLAEALGRALRDARRRRGFTQARAAAIAAVGQSTWSEAERGSGDGFTLRTWERMAHAVGVDVRAYLEGASGTTLPRDHAHARGQDFLIRSARPGGWQGTAEATIDDAAAGSRSVDVLLRRSRRPGRPDELAVLELVDWIDDVGAAIRAWKRKVSRVERQAIARMPADRGPESLPRVSGCIVVRATLRNRQLVADLRDLFSSQLPGSGRRWLRALNDPDAPMPVEPALLLISVAGDRLWAAS